MRSFGCKKTEVGKLISVSFIGNVPIYKSSCDFLSRLCKSEVKVIVKIESNRSRYEIEIENEIENTFYFVLREAESRNIY